jgi:hypothetical protein
MPPAEMPGFFMQSRERGGVGIRRIKKLLKSEEGFLAITILGVAGIIAVIGLVVIVVLWIAAYTKASDIYDTVGAAMDYAVSSVSVMTTTGTGTSEETDHSGIENMDQEQVMGNFVNAFCQITEGSYEGGEFAVPGLPGNIVLKDFYPVYPGDSIPPVPTGPGMPRLEGEEANQPGYVVHVDVPIYAGGLWNIEPARVEMKLYRLLQASPIQGG